MYFVILDKMVVRIVEVRPDSGRYITCWNLEHAMSKAADLLSLL